MCAIIEVQKQKGRRRLVEARDNESERRQKNDQSQDEQVPKRSLVVCTCSRTIHRITFLRHCTFWFQQYTFIPFEPVLKLTRQPHRPNLGAVAWSISLSGEVCKLASFENARIVRSGVPSAMMGRNSPSREIQMHDHFDLSCSFFNWIFRFKCVNAGRWNAEAYLRFQCSQCSQPLSGALAIGGERLDGTKWSSC